MKPTVPVVVVVAVCPREYPLVSCVQVCLKVFKARGRVPESYSEFAAELRQGLKPWVGPPPPTEKTDDSGATATQSGWSIMKTLGSFNPSSTGAANVGEPEQSKQPKDTPDKDIKDGTVWALADPIELSPTLTQKDLDFASSTILANVKGPNKVLYGAAASSTTKKTVWRGAVRGDKDYAIPLTPETLCDELSAEDHRNGKEVKISVISLFNLVDDTMKQRVVQTVLERLDRWAPESNGAQRRPKTTVVLDEANLAMPNNGDPDAGSAGVVQSLLRYRRSNGIAVVLGTQNPGDVNQTILNYVRLRFIGEGIAGKAKMCAPLFTGTGTMREVDVPPAVDKGADGVPQFIFDYGVPKKRESAAELKEREKKALELFGSEHRASVTEEFTKPADITKKLKAMWAECDKNPYLQQAKEALANKDGGDDDEGVDDDGAGQDDAAEEERAAARILACLRCTDMCCFSQVAGDNYTKNQRVSFFGPLVRIAQSC